VSESASVEMVAGVSVCALVQRRMTGLDPGRRQNVVQRSSHSPKAVWRSWDRGCKGHRILRRVLVGGRHLRTSRAIGFHESVVKAALAASSRGKGGAESSRELDATAGRQGEGAAAIPRKRERRQRCQRQGRGRRRGKKTPTLSIFPHRTRCVKIERQNRQRVSSHDPPKRSRVP